MRRAVDLVALRFVGRLAGFLAALRLVTLRLVGFLAALRLAERLGAPFLVRLALVFFAAMAASLQEDGPCQQTRFKTGMPRAFG